MNMKNKNLSHSIRIGGIVFLVFLAVAIVFAISKNYSAMGAVLFGGLLTAFAFGFVF
jgi:Na+/citrate or Na+/malate symporter